MTAQAKLIRQAVVTELQSLITDNLITTLQEGRLPRIRQDLLPLVRIKRGDEDIEIDELASANHALELRIEYHDIANESVDDRIDDIAEAVLTRLMDSTNLAPLITHITPLGVELDDGDADDPIATAVVRIQVNYERGL